MPERPVAPRALVSPAGAPSGARAPAADAAPPDPFWFLSEPDAFLRRFVWRTVLQRPRFGTHLRPPWLRR